MSSSSALFPIPHERILEIIKLCQAEAEIAIQEKNVPIAAIITNMQGDILISTHNTQNVSHDPTAHAEINALRALGKQRGARYLEECVVFSNAEMCSMCASACIKAHIRHFAYGAPAEPSMDPNIHLSDIAKASLTPIHIYGPVLQSECAAQIARGRSEIS
ncbi:MAG: nucleoside deaminase [Candidatus Doudnabacteria bacterium]|nr:nucleoside deaminase [Candidatus Doudnabacteria bacterium]